MSNSVLDSVAPPRVQIFLWCVLKEKILTKEELKRRGLLWYEDDLNCILCESSSENVNHLFVNYEVAKEL